MAFDNDLTNRLLDLFSHLKKTGKIKNQKDFCGKIGISQSFFTEIKKGRSGITLDKLQNVTEEFSEFKGWLLAGGETLLKDRSSSLSECLKCVDFEKTIQQQKGVIDYLDSSVKKLIEENTLLKSLLDEKDMRAS